MVCPVIVEESLRIGRRAEGPPQAECPPQCAQHGQSLVGGEEPTGADDDNRSETARRSREVKLKEADSKLSTVGTRIDREADCERRKSQQRP